MDKRCRPGDLVRVIASKQPDLVGHIAIVEKWVPGIDRWAVTMLGAPVCGTSIYTGRPLCTNDFAFKDRSLQPLRGEEPETAESPAIARKQPKSKRETVHG